MNRLVCLGWISKPERKENFSFETRVAPLRIQPKLQPRFLTLSSKRLSHNGYLEIMLTHDETRSIAVGVHNPERRACHVIFAEAHTSEIFRRHVSTRPLHHQIHRELMSAHDESLSLAMRVLLVLLAVVENGYN